MATLPLAGSAGTDLVQQEQRHGAAEGVAGFEVNPAHERGGKSGIIKISLRCVSYRWCNRVITEAIPGRYNVAIGGTRGTGLDLFRLDGARRHLAMGLASSSSRTGWQPVAGCRRDSGSDFRVVSRYRCLKCFFLERSGHNSGFASCPGMTIIFMSFRGDRQVEPGIMA